MSDDWRSLPGVWAECQCIQDESNDWWMCPEHGGPGKRGWPYPISTPPDDKVRYALPMDDSEVRQMALQNHYPEEQWYYNRDGNNPIKPRVSCGMCHQDWPCATKLALRDWCQANPGRDPRL